MISGEVFSPLLFVVLIASMRDTLPSQMIPAIPDNPISHRQVLHLHLHLHLHLYLHPHLNAVHCTCFTTFSICRIPMPLSRDIWAPLEDCSIHLLRQIQLILVALKYDMPSPAPAPAPSLFIDRTL